MGVANLNTQLDASSEVVHALASTSNCFLKLQAQADNIVKMAKVWQQALQQGHKIIFCGNGGSAADSQHLAAELVGRYQLNRQALASISLTVDTSILTAVGNDFGFEQIFVRQLAALGHSGDVLVGLSTSGNSPNVIAAVKYAKEHQIISMAFTGSEGGQLKDLADYLLAAPSKITSQIQEMHIAIGHLMCAMVERELAR